MSCHGVEAYENCLENQKERAWDMWDKVYSALNERPNCRIGILGGDQVYMDDKFGENIENYVVEKPADNIRKIYETYFYYWSNPKYRKVMARLPCLLMWDDHDIIDGWGARNEQFETDVVKWKDYGKTLSIAFEDFQGCRNIGTLSKATSQTFL